jgi:hypothetical protein
MIISHENKIAEPFSGKHPRRLLLWIWTELGLQGHLNILSLANFEFTKSCEELAGCW